ncbi:hypothetical protein RHGRI_004183 [Rhododendron griersonianum]|uniref:Uncharacterized protein n=1 Tax=Rhododendron griersonianum TaxID=479676 RepID=A0AAV6L8Q7_9ERIC|nr:hypothetical protein RHGRI_004183 [Rhododendron griersonianum]
MNYNKSLICGVEVEEIQLGSLGAGTVYGLMLRCAVIMLLLLVLVLLLKCYCCYWKGPCGLIFGNLIGDILLSENLGGRDNFVGASM